MAGRGIPSWLRLVSDTGNPSLPNYKAYTTAYDREVPASELDSVLGRLSAPAKEGFEAAVAAIEHGLAGWRTAFDISCMEAAARIAERLSRERRADTVVSFLIDHSGSMKGQRLLMAYATISALVDCLCGLGFKVDVLGFTTVSWRGGRARRDWQLWRRRKPGRLCELLHIVYRDASDEKPGMSWSARQMLRPDLPKENVDGEAIEWAVRRLRDRSEKNKVLVVLSDGAPVDDSTIMANDLEYLPGHLKSVVAQIEADGEVSIGAVDICSGHGKRYYATATEIDSLLDLGAATLKLVERLVAPAPTSAQVP
ncbi:MAG TPA: hypothetical protein VJ476_06520 [Rhizomicrobium sp.]|nr:hypothetical protein [Rhizomicrobium sp.]